VLAAACSLALVVYGAAVAWRGTNTTPRLATEQRVTANPSEAPVVAAVVSPDGKYVAYADTTGVYIRHIDTGEPAAAVAEGIRRCSHKLVPRQHASAAERAGGRSNGSEPVEGFHSGGNPQKVMKDATDGAVSADGSKIAFLRDAAEVRASISMFTGTRAKSG
jgi:hypothetical protein